MTAWSDVNVAGDSLHCPACCSQSREGFPGRAGGARSQGERGAWMLRAGARVRGGQAEGCENGSPVLHPSEIIPQQPGPSGGECVRVWYNPICFGGPVPGWQSGGPYFPPSPLSISGSAGCSQERESRRSSEREELTLGCPWL